MQEAIREGFMVFITDGDEGIGSVRDIRRDQSALLIYIENSGDFVVPMSAVKAVHSEKVILDCNHLDADIRHAIAYARESEDADYISPATENDE